MSASRLRHCRLAAELSALALVLCLLAGSATSVASVSGASGVGCTTTPADAPTCGSWWGEALPTANSSTPAAVQVQEHGSGRRLDIVHTYHRWYDDFPTAAEQALSRSGHLLLINWEPTDQEGRPMSWAAIAAGASDEQI